MRWLLNNLTFVLVAALALGLALDTFLWASHPVAWLVGGAAGSLLDPLLVIPMLACGFLLGGDWRSVGLALVMATLLEVVAINSPLRDALGEDGFIIGSWLNKFLGGILLVSLAATVRAMVLRLKNSPKPSVP